MGDKCLEINYEVTEWFTARKRCLTYEKKDMWVVKNAKELNNIKYSINFSEKVNDKVDKFWLGISSFTYAEDECGKTGEFVIHKSKRSFIKDMPRTAEIYLSSAK